MALAFSWTRSAVVTAGVITDGSANVLSNNLYDACGVLMYSSGSAAMQWRFEGRFVEEEGLVASAGGGGDALAARGVEISAAANPVWNYLSCVDACAKALFAKVSPFWLKVACTAAGVCCASSVVDGPIGVACCGVGTVCLGLSLGGLIFAIEGCMLACLWPPVYY